jgi:hypothetical protein
MDYKNLTDSELLNAVDRSNPEVSELADRLDTLLNSIDAARDLVQQLNDELGVNDQ